MNLSDRLIEHDLWLTSQLLEHAGKLTDEQLDAPFGEAVQLVCWENDANLRDLLHNLVLTKEAWVSAIYHRQWSPSEEKALPAMVDRWKAVEGDYRQLAKDVQESNRWDDLFVDALCTPPVTFSFGSVFAHILTHGATRKAIALRELRKHGIEDLGFGEPIEWEREMAKA